MIFFSCSSFYSVNFFQGTSQCVVQRLTNSTRGYSVLGFLIVFFKYSMAHGDLRFLNGWVGRGNNTVIVCIIQAKLYVGMYSKFATFFITWIHLSIQYGLAAKFFFKNKWDKFETQCSQVPALQKSLQLFGLFFQLFDGCIPKKLLVFFFRFNIL